MVKPVENKPTPPVNAVDESSSRGNEPKPDGVKEFEKHTRPVKSEEKDRMLDEAANESGLKKLAKAGDGKDFHDVAGKVLGYKAVNANDKGASKEDVKTFENAESLRKNIASSNWKDTGINIATTDEKYLQDRSAAFQGGDSADGKDDRILLSDKAVRDGSKATSEGINAEMFHAFERIVHDGKSGDARMVGDEVAFSKEGAAIDEGELGKLAVQQYAKEGRADVKALTQDATVTRDDTFGAEGSSTAGIQLEGQVPVGEVRDGHRLPPNPRDEVALEGALTEAIAGVHNLTNFQRQGTSASDGMQAMLDNAAAFPDKLQDFANQASVVAHHLDLAQDIRHDIGDGNKQLLKEYSETMSTNFYHMSKNVVDQIKTVSKGVADNEKKVEREAEIRNLAIVGAALGGISTVLGVGGAAVGVYEEVLNKERDLLSTGKVAKDAASATIGAISTGVGTAGAAKIHQLWSGSIVSKYGGGETDPGGVQNKAVVKAASSLANVFAHNKVLTGDTTGDDAVKHMALGAQTMEAGAEHASMIANLSRVGKKLAGADDPIVKSIQGLGFDVKPAEVKGLDFLPMRVSNTDATQAQLKQNPSSGAMKAGILMMPNDPHHAVGPNTSLTRLDDFNWVDNTIILNDLHNRAAARAKQVVDAAGGAS